MRDSVEYVVLVSDDEIVDAIRLLLTRAKWLAEGAGAASVAALIKGKVSMPPNAKVCCVVSGGNIDLARLKSVL